MRSFFVSTLLALVAIAPLSAQSVPAGSEQSVGAKSQADAVDWRRSLLELADSAFTRMPLDPHAKNRGRGQLTVVEASLAAGLPELGAGIAKKIPDWRRGLAHAHCAQWLQQHERGDEAERELQLAEQAAKAIRADANEQAWRAERILGVVARVRMMRGEMEKFAEASKELGPVEGAVLQEEAALRMPEESFAKWLEQADTTIASAQFDPIQATLQSCAKLYRRFYEDEDKRAQLEKRVAEGYSKLPLQVRVKLLVEIGGVAADKKDAAKTIEICDRIDRVLATAAWRAEDKVPAFADLAVLLHRGGEVARGKQQLDAAAKAFADGRASIFDIYRAASLRSLAEAAAAMGDSPRAMEFWRAAVEAGVENPNSRPRADDLGATCLSFVKAGVQPEAGIEKRLREIAGSLAAPW